MSNFNHLQTIQDLFEIYYQNDNDKVLDELFLTIKNSLMKLKQQNDVLEIKQLLIYLASEIGCADDLERCELMLNKLLDKNIFNQNELTPFWDNLHLRQG